MKNIYLIVAKQVVEEAATIIREARDTNAFGYTFKDDDTPVSHIDQQVQDYMTNRLTRSFDIPVLGEENCDAVDRAKPYWSVDPIDGTWAFITHENTSAINLSLIEEGRPTVAIVCNPFTRELFYTERGIPSYMGMVQMPMRRPDGVEVVNFKPEHDIPILPAIERMYRDGSLKKMVCLGGSIAYSLCMVAKGAFSNYVCHFRSPANPWDLSAGWLILKNAGGCVTDLDGNPIDPMSHKGYIVASADERCRDAFLKNFV